VVSRGWFQARLALGCFTFSVLCLHLCPAPSPTGFVVSAEARCFRLLPLRSVLRLLSPDALSARRRRRPDASASDPLCSLKRMCGLEPPPSSEPSIAQKCLPWDVLARTRPQLRFSGSEILAVCFEVGDSQCLRFSLRFAGLFLGEVVFCRAASRVSGSIPAHDSLRMRCLGACTCGACARAGCVHVRDGVCVTSRCCGGESPGACELRLLQYPTRSVRQPRAAMPLVLLFIGVKRRCRHAGPRRARS
jgi:hypothetical protein